MLLEVWLFLGLLGVLVAGVGLWTDDNAIAMVAGALGTVVWGTMSYASLSIDVVSDGQVETFSVPSISVIALTIAILMLYILLTGPIELVQRYRSGDPREL